ncbi:MAG: esterase-like activity of phytase family protein [Pseudomonadota bacterium]
MRHWIGLLSVFALTACGGAGAGDRGVDPSGESWRASASLDALRTASCPEGVDYVRAPEIDLSITPLDMSGLEPGKHLVGRTTVVGGWELTSTDARFGGLSGLAAYSSGNLLAVSDQGAFVWLTIKDGAPTKAHLSPMLNASGAEIENKTRADAEGITLIDGLALVSFEREHRIEAFDLEGCGASARAAPVMDLPAHPRGLLAPMESNGGAEAIAYSASQDITFVGVETTSERGQPLMRLDSAGTMTRQVHLDAPREYTLTGLDAPSYYPYALFRHYSPNTGNKNIIAYVDGTATPRYGLFDVVRLDPSVPVDNFEGIAVQDLGDGVRRVWIVSDDNFSETQRTLLMAFDLT